MQLYFTILLVVSSKFCPVHSILNSSGISEILETFRGKQFRFPPRNKGESVKVELSIIIQSMVPLKTINNHIYMETDILLSWFDSRLKFKNHTADDRITIQREEDMFFWRPDIYINHEKGIKYEQVPEKLSGAWISPDGKVFYFSRQHVAVFCPMKLDTFPFDKQQCSVHFESYSYNREQLRFELQEGSEKPVLFGKNFLASRFILERYDVLKQKKDYGATGIFDQIVVALYFKRDVRYYIMEFYLPVIGMVVLSFVSFWIHFKSTPARVALPTTILLTMSSMINHIRSNSVLYDTAEALEIFLNISLYFVLFALLEYVVAEMTDNRWLRISSERKPDYHAVHSTFSPVDADLAILMGN